MRTYYLSARWQRRQELSDYRESLVTHKFGVVSRWLDSEERPADPDAAFIYNQQAAWVDLADIITSDVFVGFTDFPSCGYYSGGRQVEFGYALSLPDKPICIVGPRENVFHHLPRVKVFESFTEFLTYEIYSYATRPL
jgi:hypothetical protein